MALQSLFSMKLSVAIATHNEEKNLGACLASISAWVDEIVLVDGGSTDRTLAIARKYKARIIRTDNPPIFHINKQKALDACRGEWVLQLDADEVVSSQLREEILNIITSSQYSGYYIPRKNYFLGHWMRKGGQFPDYVIRLFKRNNGRFPCLSVHEQIEIDGNVGYVKNLLNHYSSTTLAEYWCKANAYISLSAQTYKERKLPINFLTFMEYNFIKPTITFLILFIRHKGFIDGVWGFLFALFSALHHPLAYQHYVKNNS